MIQQSFHRLKYLCATIPTLLRKFTEDELAYKPTADKWSRKAIIGHLIDSATNNNHRFIRAQFEETPQITYDQVQWNRYGYYQQMKGDKLIAFWTMYNEHLAELIRMIPAENLERECNTGGTTNVTIAFLIDDYVSHLEHHLKQIVAY